MKKTLSVILSIILTLSLLPVYTVQSAAEITGDANPSFRVDVSNNQFTIWRENDMSEQTVAYRTVSVTAVEGIHFTAAMGTVTFAYGEWYKIIPVTETAVADIPIRYRYQSGRYREYRFEVLDTHGFLLASANRQIDYGDDYTFNNASINSSVPELYHGDTGCQTQYYGDVYYDGTTNKSVKVTDAGYKQGVHSVSTANIFTLPNLAPREYLSAIGDKIYAAVDISAREDNDGYQYIQILADNNSTYDDNDPYADVNTPSVSLYKACFERDVGSSPNSIGGYMTFPHRYDYKNKEEESAAGIVRSEFWSNENCLWAQKFRNNSVKAPNAGAILLDPMTQELNFRFDAGGKDGDTWYFTYMKVRYAIGDEFPPYPTDNIYVSGNSSYAKYSPVTITVCFNEIVVPGAGCVLKTTWGNFPVISTNGYANVLSFSGVITANPGTQLKITGIEGTVSDLFGRNMEVGLSRTLSHTVGQNAPLTSSNGVYLIRNAAELYSYAAMLESYPDRSGKLMSDIDMVNSELAGFQAMGGANGFTGTFDGNGHDIINLTNVSAAANGFCGLFGFISAGGRVQNLGVEISFTAPLGSSGAICGFNLGTVENCVVSGTIKNSLADSNQSTSANRFGGVVGDNRGIVRHCLALNKLANFWANPVFGGIVGYNTNLVDSCCFYGAFSSNFTMTRGAVCGENAVGGTITNCAARQISSNYYSYAIGTNNGTATNTLFMPTADFASGKACCDVLNNGVSDGTQFWHQNIDNGETPDERPRSTGGTVYRHGNTYTNLTVVHTLSPVAAVEPGCETAGCAAHWVCTHDGCDKIFSDENGQNETTLAALEIPALGHSWGTMWYFDTAGHNRKCTRCGAASEVAAHVADAPEYVWSSDNSTVTGSVYCTVCHCTVASETVHTTIDSNSATCTQGGTAVYRATFTKAAFTTQTKEVPVAALGHDYVATVTDPTCTEPGYTTHTCSRCGDSYVDSPTQALGHDWETAWNDDDTYHWHGCSRCSATTEPQPHTYGEPQWNWYAVSSATAIFSCTECGHELTKEADVTVTVTGHTATYTATVTFNGQTYTDSQQEYALAVGENTVPIVENQTLQYLFYPSEDGDYRFYSQGDYDPEIQIYDGEIQLAIGDDTGDGANFSAIVSLEGGRAYDIYLYSYDGTGDLTLFITRPQIYTVTVDEQIQHGYVYVLNADGNLLERTVEGEQVTLDFWADNGYRLGGFTVTDANGTVITDASAEFTMPASNVTVSADFIPDQSLPLGENAVYVTADRDMEYTFTPSQSGEYRFFSEGGYDPQISLYDGETLVASHDDADDSNCNFDLTTILESGKTYRIVLHIFSHGEMTVGLMTMWIERPDLPYDVNVDGVIDESDYDLVVSAALGDVTLKAVQQAKADFNGDSIIDVLDCREFKRLLNPQP